MEDFWIIIILWLVSGNMHNYNKTVLIIKADKNKFFSRIFGRPTNEEITKQIFGSLH